MGAISLSTELGVAEREGRYGFRRARRGPSVGHSCSVGLIVRSAPVHNLLPHTHFRHSYTPPHVIPLRTTKSSEIVSRNGISLSLHPASFASVAQSARRRPPSALSSSAASSASSSRSALPGFSPALPLPFSYSARPPVGWAASSRPHSNRTTRTARVRCRAVSE